MTPETKTFRQSLREIFQTKKVLAERAAEEADRKEAAGREGLAQVNEAFLELSRKIPDFMSLPAIVSAVKAPACKPGEEKDSIILTGINPEHATILQSHGEPLRIHLNFHTPYSPEMKEIPSYRALLLSAKTLDIYLSVEDTVRVGGVLGSVSRNMGVVLSPLLPFSLSPDAALVDYDVNTRPARELTSAPMPQIRKQPFPGSGGTPHG